MTPVALASPAADVTTTIAARRLVEGSGWRLDEIVCQAGPGDRPFEERHDRPSISVVVAGTFVYRSDAGRSVLYPGALLLGNRGACYCCGHEHGEGDQCRALQFEPDFFEEIAATAAATSRFRFPLNALPASEAWIELAAQIQTLDCMRDGLGRDERVIALAAAILARLSGEKRRPVRLSARDERRISLSLRHIERHVDQRLELRALAAQCGMSPFHFLRTFRNVAGMTPHQFVLGARLRRVASQLVATRERVSSLVFAAGFEDLSTFNRMFRQRLGVTPSAYRARNR